MEHGSEDEGSPIDWDLLVNTKDVPKVFLGNLFPAANLPDDWSKKDINKELDGKFKVMFLGRTRREFLGVTKILENIYGGDPRRGLGTVREMESFLNSVSGDLSFIPENGGSDAKRV